MKKIILHIIAITLAFGTAVTVSAEIGVNASAEVNVNASTSRPLPLKPILRDIKEIRVETKDQIKDLREKMASSTKDLRNGIEEKKKELIQNRVDHRFDKMIARYEATIEREEAMMARIVSRIEKIKTNGGNTTDAEKFINQAKDSITKAKSALETLKTSTNTAIIQETASSTRIIAKETLTAMRKAGNDVEKYLRETHKSLVQAVSSLMNFLRLKVQATSTTQINTQI